MELVILSGMTMLGKMLTQPKNIDKTTRDTLNVYHTNQVGFNHADRARYMAERVEQSKNPAKTNIIAPTFNLDQNRKTLISSGGKSELPTENYNTVKKEMGIGTNVIKGVVPENFTNNFNLMKFNKNEEIVANNDVSTYSQVMQNSIAESGKWASISDETYQNCTDNTCSMLPNTSQRDFGMIEESFEQTSALEIFTGSSKNYFPKGEVESFFAPQKNVTFVNGMPNFTGVIKDRYEDAVKLERRNERPFEQRQIGPGLGLNQDQDAVASGFHDTTRVQYGRTIDELRRKDLPQISYSADPLVGQFGSKQPIQGDTYKRRPDQFKEYNQDDYLMGQSNQVTAPEIRDNINLRVGNRIFSSELIGPAQEQTYRKYDPATEGIINQSSRNIYEEPDNDNIAANYTINNPNIPSYEIKDNNRNLAQFNAQILSNVQNSRVQVYDNIGPRTTLRETTEHFTNEYQPLGNQNNILPVTNYSDTARNTTKETTLDTLYAGIGTTNNILPITNYSDTARNTTKETTLDTLYAGLGTNNNILPSAYYNDDIKTTVKQTTLDNVLVGVGNQNNILPSAYFNDNIKTTVKQTTLDNLLVGISNQNKILPSAYYNDDIKTTVKQTTLDNLLAAIGNQNNIGNPAYISDEIKTTVKQTTLDNLLAALGNQNTITNPAYISDEIKTTVKQTTLDNLLAALGNQNNITNRAYISDEIKKTTKETMVYEPQYNPAGSKDTNTLITTYLSDLAKTTVRETTDEDNHVNPAGSKDINKLITTYLSDLAKTTVRETTDEDNHVNPAANNMYSTTFDPDDQARITIKQLTDILDYVNNPGFSSGHTTEQDYHNAHLNINKENVTKLRSLPKAPPTHGPDVYEYTNTHLKNPINWYDTHKEMPTVVRNITADVIDKEYKSTLSDIRNSPYYNERINNNLVDTLRKNPYYVDPIGIVLRKN